MSNWFNNGVGPQVRAPKAKASKTIPVLAVVLFLASLQCATQFFAHEFQYQSALGAHMRQLFAPWSMLLCAGRWYAAYTDAIMRAGYIGFSMTPLGLIALVIARMVRADSARRNLYLQGSARWADLKDMRVSGLLARWRTWWEVTTGKALTAAAHMYVGAWLDKRGTQYLVQNGPEHDLGYAPPRSGNNRTGRKLIRRFWVGRSTQENRRNNHALSVEEYLIIAPFRTRLRNQRKTSMAFEKGKRLPRQGGWENGIKGGRPTKFQQEVKRLPAEQTKRVMAELAKKYLEDQLKRVLDTYFASAIGKVTGEIKCKLDPATTRHYVERLVGPAPRSANLDLAVSVEEFYEHVINSEYPETNLKREEDSGTIVGCCCVT